MTPISTAGSALRRYRFVLSAFIVGLVLSGVTAFPLLHELALLSRTLGIADPARYADYTGLRHWIALAHFGLRETHAAFPFLAYGTDWLAFGHIIIAIFFLGPLRDPVRNIWILHAGLIACAGVIPLAFICGAVRGIPIYWRLIDCSFGVIGALPLLYCLRLTRQIENLSLQNTVNPRTP